MPKHAPSPTSPWRFRVYKIRPARANASLERFDADRAEVAVRHPNSDRPNPNPRTQTLLSNPYTANEPEAAARRGASRGCCAGSGSCGTDFRSISIRGMRYTNTSKRKYLCVRDITPSLTMCLMAVRARVCVLMSVGGRVCGVVKGGVAWRGVAGRGWVGGRGAGVGADGARRHTARARPARARVRVSVAQRPTPSLFL